MDKSSEAEVLIEILVKEIDKRRAGGEPFDQIEDVIRSVKAQYGERKLTGEANMTIPLPRTVSG